MEEVSAGVNCFAAAVISLVQIRPLQPKLLLFQQLPQTCNHSNLYRKDIREGRA